MQFFKQLPTAARALALVTTLLVLILVFGAGTAVGRKQAEFGYRWDRHYVEVFDGMSSPFAMGFASPAGGGDMMMIDHRSLPNGAAGKIVAINLPTLAVTDPNNFEKVIVVAPDTTIRRIRMAASSTDLQIGDVVTAIGIPDPEGRIRASFIRVMPALPTSTMPASQR